MALRRIVLVFVPVPVFALAAAGALFAAGAHAQTPWPTRPIKLIVPFAPGGSNDILGRALATKLADRLGQPIVVENRGGAGGTIGTDAVAKSAPDGTTLLFASASMATNAASGKKLPYDIVRDLEPIALVGAGPFVVVVANDFKGATFGDFLALARAKPGAISYGSAGIGGMNHLGTEMLAAVAKIRLVHVPYKGMNPAFTDLMGGNLQMLLPTLASAAQQIRGGRVRGLAVTGARRSPLAPDIPTVAESGFPEFDLQVWWGFLGPARLPAPIVKKLNDEVNGALGLADVREMLAREGATPQPGTPEAFGALVRLELARWTKLLKETNIPAE